MKTSETVAAVGLLLLFAAFSYCMYAGANAIPADITHFAPTVAVTIVGFVLFLGGLLESD